MSGTASVRPEILTAGSGVVSVRGQEQCESQGGRPGKVKVAVLGSPSQDALWVAVDVKLRERSSS